jgi:glutamine cyclotransferase
VNTALPRRATSRSRQTRRRRPVRAARALGPLALAAAAVAGWFALAGDHRRSAAAPAPPVIEQLRVRVLAVFPHDRRAYTQGLLWENGGFVESSGLYGQSFVRRWRPDQPRPLVEERLAGDVFGEGLAAMGERLIQITWREGVAFYRDRVTLAEIDRRTYDGEGWGLCWDGSRLIMSDGSATLTLRDGETFAPLDTVVVRAGAAPVRQLNELECVDGAVYANLYGSDRIARIDPASGQVSAWIDASGLLTDAEIAGGAEVLNGIAYNPDTATFYLTGKRWPRLFEVVFEPSASPVER